MELFNTAEKSTKWGFSTYVDWKTLWIYLMGALNRDRGRLLFSPQRRVDLHTFSGRWRGEVELLKVVNIHLDVSVSVCLPGGYPVYFYQNILIDNCFLVNYRPGVARLFYKQLCDLLIRSPSHCFPPKSFERSHA